MRLIRKTSSLLPHPTLILWTWKIPMTEEVSLPLRQAQDSLLFWFLHTSDYMFIHPDCEPEVNLVQRDLRHKENYCSCQFAATDKAGWRAGCQEPSMALCQHHSPPARMQQMLAGWAITRHSEGRDHWGKRHHHSPRRHLACLQIPVLSLISWATPRSLCLSSFTCETDIISIKQCHCEDPIRDRAWRANTEHRAEHAAPPQSPWQAGRWPTPLFPPRRLCDSPTTHCLEEHVNPGFGERATLATNESDTSACTGERKPELKAGLLKCWCFLKITGSGYLNWIPGPCPQDILTQGYVCRTMPWGMEGLAAQEEKVSKTAPGSSRAELCCPSSTHS